jgi:hypothetical protein
MRSELTDIHADHAALAFAFGCLLAAVRLAVGAGWRRTWDKRQDSVASSPSKRRFRTMNALLERPRLLGLFCAAAAVAAGAGYMAAAGAPSLYLFVNLAALGLGAACWVGLRGTGSRLAEAGAGSGAVILALGVALLLTAMFGVGVEGASRWVRIGPMTLQASLVVAPVTVVLYARRPDLTGTLGMAVAALALALQPDRGMAGVLLAATLAVAAAAPGRLPFIAASASALAFGWALLRPDALPAVPYVDRVLYSAFEVHFLAGSAVVVGAAILVVPVIASLSAAPRDRPALLAFGACWAAVVEAAALGNYPTPLVGYGGAAVLGYLLSVALLPGGARESRGRSARAASPTAPSVPERGPLELRAT